MKLFFITLLFFFSFTAKAETSNLIFATEYLNELKMLNAAANSLNKDLNLKNNEFAANLRYHNLSIFELNFMITKLNGLELKNEEINLAKHIIDIYNIKIKTHQDTIKYLSVLVVGQKLSADQKASLKLSLLHQEELDNQLFKLSPLFCRLMMDANGNSILTDVERLNLIKDIKTSFGIQLKDKKTHIIDAVLIILDYLKNNDLHYR